MHGADSASGVSIALRSLRVSLLPQGAALRAAAGLAAASGPPRGDSGGAQEFGQSVHAIAGRRSSRILHLPRADRTHVANTSLLMAPHCGSLWGGRWSRLLLREVLI